MHSTQTHFQHQNQKVVYHQCIHHNQPPECIIQIMKIIQPIKQHQHQLKEVKELKEIPEVVVEESMHNQNKFQKCPALELPVQVIFTIKIFSFLYFFLIFDYFSRFRSTETKS